MQNGFLHNRGSLRIEGHAIRMVPCPDNVSTPYGPGPHRPTEVVIPVLPGLYRYCRKVIRRAFAQLKCCLQMHSGCRIAAKTTFSQEKVNYLGHVISREGVSPDAGKIEKVRSWPIPCSLQAVQQFLGFASYYRRFTKDFTPLHLLTEKGTAFK